MSILDDAEAMAAIRDVGYGFLVLCPTAGESVDDEKYERMVVRMAEKLKEIGESEDATYIEIVCVALEFAARIVSAPLSMKASPRSEHRRVADEMAKNLRKRIMGSCRNEGPAQETQEH